MVVDLILRLMSKWVQEMRGSPTMCEGGNNALIIVILKESQNKANVCTVSAMEFTVS